VQLTERLNTFSADVVAKNWLKAKQPSFALRYLRIVFIRRMTELVLCTLLIFGAEQFLTLNDFIAPLWPTAGVGLGAIFLRGYFLLVAVFLGTLGSYVHNHLSWFISLQHSLLFTAFLFAVRFLALRWIGPVTPIATAKIFGQFTTLIMIASAVHIILIMPISLNAYLMWLAEINGILCLTTLCLIFNPFMPSRYLQWVLSFILMGGCSLYYIFPDVRSQLGLSLFLLTALSIYAKYFGQIPTCITLISILVLLTPIQLGVQLTLLTLTIILSLNIATYTLASR